MIFMLVLNILEGDEVRLQPVMEIRRGARVTSRVPMALSRPTKTAEA
jgi:hypothetical protein